MKSLAAFAVVALLSVPASAEDALVKGGRSPDGAYEVRVVRKEGEPSGYGIQVHDTSGKKPAFTLSDTGSHLDYNGAVEHCTADWNKSGDLVAITDRKAERSRELFILSVTPDSTEELRIPDYIQNALGRIDQTMPGNDCATTPREWGEDNLLLDILLKSNFGGMHECRAVLKVLRDGDTARRVYLTLMTDPIEIGGPWRAHERHQR